MNDFLFLYGNSLYIAGCLLGLYYAYRWLRFRDLSRQHKQVVLSWCLIFLSFGLLHGYWILARWLSPPHLPHLPVMFEYGFIPALLSGLMFVSGMILFITALAAKSIPYLLPYLITGVFIAAGAIAAIAN